MSVKEITIQELRRMHDREGIIFQGCGGDPQEWLDGVNSLLTEVGILKNGTKFEEAYSFQKDGITCLLFPFSDAVDMDAGKLAILRLQSYDTFAGTWLSDYVPNRLGGFLSEEAVQSAEETPRIEKPDCPLIGQDGNIFNLIGIASRTLRDNGLSDQAREMQNRITQATLTISYEADKLKALKLYLTKKESSVEDILLKELDALYQKNVPATVRFYLEHQVGDHS